MSFLAAETMRTAVLNSVFASAGIDKTSSPVWSSIDLLDDMGSRARISRSMPFAHTADPRVAARSPGPEEFDVILRLRHRSVKRPTKSPYVGHAFCSARMPQD